MAEKKSSSKRDSKVGATGDGRKRIRKSVVIVGDGMTGKSCLLSVFVNGEFYENYQPTVFENCRTDIEIDDRTVVDLTIHDTAGQEEYSQLRPFSYHAADVCLLCFSIDNPDSLDNIEDQWMPEVRKYCPQARYILVGLKKDLRYDPEVIKHLAKRSSKPLAQEDGRRVCVRIGACSYFECSSKYQDGVAQIFEAAARVTLAKRGSSRHQRDKCRVM